MADGSITIDTKVDQTGLKTGLSGMAKTVSTGIGAALTAAATALVALGKQSIDTGKEFDSAMSNLAATMGTTTDSITELADKAKELGSTTKFTATEAAEGLNILAQSGLDASEQLEVITPTLNLAAAGEMDMDEAAGYLTSTIKSMGLEMSDATHLADVYAKGATLANTDTADFGEAMSKAAILAGNYGQSVETTGAELLAMADAGITGKKAGTTLSRTLQDLYTPTDAAAAKLNELGVACYDSAGNQRDSVDVINDLNDALSTMTPEERAAAEATIFTTNGMTGFDAITKKSSEDLDGLVDSLNDCTGAAEEMAATKLDNLEGDITLLSSATDGFKLAIYENMRDPCRAFVQEGTDLMSQMSDAVNENGLTGLVDSLGDILAQAVTFLAGYVPEFVDCAVNLVEGLVQGLNSSSGTIANVATSVISSLISGFLSITNDLIELGCNLIISLCDGLSKQMPDIFSTMGTGISKMISTIGTMIPQVMTAGVQLLTGIIDGLANAMPQMLTFITNAIEEVLLSLNEQLPVLMDAIVGFFETIAEDLPEMMALLTDQLPDLLETILDAISGFIPEIIAVIPDLIDSIVSMIQELLPELIECGVDMFSSLIEELPTIISNIVAVIPEIIDSVVSSLLELVPTIVDCGVQLLTSLIQNLPQIIYDIVYVLPQIIDSIIATLVGLIPSLIECGVELLTSLVSDLSNIIITIVAVLPEIVMSIVEALIDQIPLLIQCGVDLLTSLIDDMPDVITAIVMALPTIIASIINALVSNTSQIAAAGVELLTAIVKNIPTIISTIVKAVPQIIKALVQAFGNCVSQMASVGSNLIKGVWQGIQNAKQWLVDKIKGLGSTITSAIKSVLGIHSPSKVFRDVIGKNLMLGLAEGIEDESDTAVGEVEKAAEEIANVDFGLNDDLASDFVTAAQSATIANQQEIASQQAYVSAGTVETETDENDTGIEPSYILNELYLDGKKVGRIMTPYISQRMAWED